MPVDEFKTEELERKERGERGRSEERRYPFWVNRQSSAEGSILRRIHVHYLIVFCKYN